MSAMFAVGSIIGSLATAAVKLPAKYHALAVVSALILLVGDVMFMSFAWHWGVMFVLDFIAGIGNSVLNAYIFGIIMTRTPSEKLGRVSAAIGAIIKRNERFAGVPVIMLSSKDGLFDKARGRMVGSQDYLTKPFTKDQLLQAVQQHCRGA